FFLSLLLVTPALGSIKLNSNVTDCFNLISERYHGLQKDADPKVFLRCVVQLPAQIYASVMSWIREESKPGSAAEYALTDLYKTCVTRFAEDMVSGTARPMDPKCQYFIMHALDHKAGKNDI
ncbi:hypothetical protein PMAYCL1PPCAC_14194, partial [Pristionchus mayeri]